jgi:formate hydrogenlyase subunit 3/multisubunit Na+/H+ antiporter MnhD subunit
MEQLGRTLLIVGGVIVLVGLFLTFGPRLPFRLGRLPLDIHVQRDNFSFYFPLGTSIIVSIVLTLVFGLLNRR